jgi:hypothetical protein
MRKGLITLIALGLMLLAAPAYAQEGTVYDEGTFAVGIGGGFSGDTDVGPFVLSGKYWNETWEIGAEVYTSFEDESQDYDQVGLGWIAWRYDVSMTEDGATYVGIGGAGLFEDYTEFSNSFGPVGLIGWDGEEWGGELKIAWFDPIVASGVVYYNFNSDY